MNFDQALDWEGGELRHANNPNQAFTTSCKAITREPIISVSILAPLFQHRLI